MRTELPERWYVVRTPENAQVLNDWADSVYPFPDEYERENGPGIVTFRGGSYELNQTFWEEKLYKEITYEEFTKLVLKKNV